MKALKTLVLLITIFCLFFLVSCSKEQEALPTRSALLAGDTEQGRSYFITSAEVDLVDVNGTLILLECVIDNTISYYPDGRYEENEGRSKCDSEDPPGLVGTWTFINGETQLSITLDGSEEIWEVVSITDQGHRLTKNSDNGEVTFVLERL